MNCAGLELAQHVARLLKPNSLPSWTTCLATSLNITRTWPFPVRSGVGPIQLIIHKSQMRQERGFTSHFLPHFLASTEAGSPSLQEGQDRMTKADLTRGLFRCCPVAMPSRKPVTRAGCPSFQLHVCCFTFGALMLKGPGQPEELLIVAAGLAAIDHCFLWLCPLPLFCFYPLSAVFMGVSRTTEDRDSCLTYLGFLLLSSPLCLGLIVCHLPLQPINPRQCLVIPEACQST